MGFIKCAKLWTCEVEECRDTAKVAICISIFKFFPHIHSMMSIFQFATTLLMSQEKLNLNYNPFIGTDS